MTYEKARTAVDTTISLGRKLGSTTLVLPQSRCKKHPLAQIILPCATVSVLARKAITYIHSNFSLSSMLISGLWWEWKCSKIELLTAPRLLCGTSAAGTNDSTIFMLSTMEKPKTDNDLICFKSTFAECHSKILSPDFTFSFYFQVHTGIRETAQWRDPDISSTLTHCIIQSRRVLVPYLLLIYRD